IFIDSSPLLGGLAVTARATSRASLARDLGALLSRLGETDRDGLLPALDRFAAASALQFSALHPVHGRLHPLAGRSSVLPRHHCPPRRRRRGRAWEDIKQTPCSRARVAGRRAPATAQEAARASRMRTRPSATWERGEPKFRRTNPCPPRPNVLPSFNATRARSRKNVKGSAAAEPAARQSSQASDVASGAVTVTPGRCWYTKSTTKSRLASR